MNIGIYKITSPSGKIYIGQSINIENRWNNYKNTVFNKKTKLYKSFQKHGIGNHIFEIIEECPVEQLNEREIYWKQYYLEQVNNDWSKVLFHELYDLGGGPKSEETKQKIGLKNKKPKPEDFSKKISKSILQYDLEGNFIKEWSSITEARNYNDGDIQACLLNKQKTAGKYIWKYWVKNYPLKIEINILNKNKNKPKSEKWKKQKYKPILQYDLEGNFIKEWESSIHIKNELKYSQSSICNCCLGKYKTSYGYIWKYK